MNLPTAPVLIELFVEELPPKALKKLGESFASGLHSALVEQGLTPTHSAVEAFASPRRLAVLIQDVFAQANSRVLRHKLMPVSVGLDAQGQPSPALLKKISALGLPPTSDITSQLERALDGKSETLFIQTTAPGASLAQGLQKALDSTLAALPIPKVMQYQLEDGWSSVQFVRPAHGLVALHGPDIIPVTTLGLQAGRQTQGHRFEALQSVLTLAHASDYAQVLHEQGAVIASFSKRRAEIKRQLQAVAQQAGGQPIEDEALLDEVTGLVERPNVLLCEFEKEFLQVPAECLILTMKANQKYFPLLDAAGQLTHQFLVVSNIRPQDPSAVIGGNERVVRPRLADAKFFYDQDRKKTLASRLPQLQQVVYHNQLGTLGERVERVTALARWIGQQWQGDALAEQAAQAAQLAKTDLLTDMVGEFPELQGTMGGYYARHEGFTEAVAQAVEDHYRPRFAGDELPRNEVAITLALADKLETLVGLFAIGQVPTGDKDPFALRRHALGVIRMCIERHLPLSLTDMLSQAESLLREQKPQLKLHPVGPVLVPFVHDRLNGLLREQGYSAQEVDAVLSLQPQRLSEVPPRMVAVRAFGALPEAAAMASANKRVSNILKKVEGALPEEVSAALLHEPAEQALAQTVRQVLPASQAAFQSGELTRSMQLLAALKEPVDAFFDQVMVNAPQPELRANRLALLRQLQQAMNQVADLSKLVVG
jgi:glycyl-tRNA synthetase beta chain